MIRYLFLFLLVPIFCRGQQNCNYFLLGSEDSSCYKACLIAKEAAQLQGSSMSQKKFDKAINLCPTLAYAYSEKSVPFLKRGDFIKWKQLIDKAVELDSVTFLGYRGWCRYQFLSDYKGAIEDFESLERLSKSDIGYSINGDYHLIVAKALCYKAIGNNKLAIEIIDKQLNQEGYNPMPYDYLHLGILKIETGNIEDAITCLEREISINDYLADTYYYLGIAFKTLGNRDKCLEYLHKAKTFYLKGYKRIDPYTEPIDKVYLSDIEEKLKESLK